MNNNILRLCGIFGMAAVALGAFGAHLLKPHLSTEAYSIFETAVKYHFVHTLALMGVGILMHFGRKKALTYAVGFFSGGIIAFSGSLYLLATDELLGVRLSWLGPVTPIGGVLLIAGWGAIFMAASTGPAQRSDKQEQQPNS
jgi:uncharacterized membrane protein YgdD (TMEM256/DUF423 family)